VSARVSPHGQSRASRSTCSQPFHSGSVVHDPADFRILGRRTQPYRPVDEPRELFGQVLAAERIIA
jgi:hypothetical protein